MFSFTLMVPLLLFFFWGGSTHPCGKGVNEAGCFSALCKVYRRMFQSYETPQNGFGCPLGFPKQPKVYHQRTTHPFGCAQNQTAGVIQVLVFVSIYQGAMLGMGQNRTTSKPQVFLVSMHHPFWGDPIFWTPRPFRVRLERFQPMPGGLRGKGSAAGARVTRGSGGEFAAPVSGFCHVLKTDSGR